jgi:photosystem II stability/assembly factor-like uncharacterized protein
VQAALAGGTALADGTLVLVSQAGDVLLSRDQGSTFAIQAGPALPPALPLAAVAQARDGALVLAGLRGLRRVPPPGAAAAAPPAPPQ